jgi:hypothetical protein
MTIYAAAINLETRVMKFNGGTIFFADTVGMQHMYWFLQWFPFKGNENQYLFL